MKNMMKSVALAFLATVMLTEAATAEVENHQLSESLRKNLKENFGYPGMETSWYKSITGLSVAGKTVAVNTSLSKTATAQEAAKSICQAVSGYVFSKENRVLGLEHIQVLSSDGSVVVSRRGFTDRCEVR